MARYHVNNSDEVGTCKASKEGCPFGSPEEHFSDRADAQKEAEGRLEKKHGLINKVYKAGGKDTSEAQDLHPDVKKRIVQETAEGKNNLHPSVVAKVFANDRDELVRRKVAENVKSQNVLRKMSDDESEKVRLSVAKTTKNPDVLKKLSKDSDTKVRNAALKNERMPKRAKKKTVAEIKSAQAEAREAKTKGGSDAVDMSDSNNYSGMESSTTQTTMKPEALDRLRKSGKSAHEMKGFSEDARPTPGVKGDYQISERNGRSQVTYYSDLNDSSYTTSKTFKTKDEAREFAKGDDGLISSQKQYSKEEEEKINQRHKAYMKSRARSNYTGD